MEQEAIAFDDIAVHRIRLLGPWEYCLLQRVEPAGEVNSAQSDGRTPAGRIVLPSDWGSTLGQSFRGQVRYSRRFGAPMGLASSERVWLVVDGVDAYARVSLNGQALGEAFGPVAARFDVTTLLESRNELWLDVEKPVLSPAPVPQYPGREQLPGGPVGEVRLEIAAATSSTDASASTGGELS